MKPPSLRRPMLPCEVHRHPQLPAVSVLRSAVTAVIPALLNAHPPVAAGRLSSTTEIAADDVVRLAQRLRLAIDNYHRILRDVSEF